MMKNVVNVIIFLSIIMTFSSCGYSSSAKFSRAVIGEKISTTVVVSSQDPENSVVMKDALDSAILEVFHSSLTTKKRSKTHIELSIFDIRYTPMQYDKYGYIIAYRATTTLKIIKT
ncbi:MAG: hypothetical protein U9P38_02145, partial [Campylobacterota bacterium]|nr:hypothetical protein [Campylobacterota bacterium]